MPLHELQKEFNSNDYEEAKHYLEWYNQILEKWDGVSFISSDIDANKGFVPGEKVSFTAKVNTNGTAAEHLGVFAVVEYDGVSGNLKDPEFVRLTYDKANDVFSSKYTLSRSGKLKVGFLVTPFHRFLKNPFELNKAKWA